MLLSLCPTRDRWLLDRPVKPGDDSEQEMRSDGAYFRREIGTYSRSVGPV
jgi:hypothetical protein